MFTFYRQPGKTGMENFRARGLEDPTSRWRVKQAAYQRSKKRGHAKCEENFVRNFTHLPPSLKLDPLILRTYQECTPGLRLRRFEFAAERVGAGKSEDQRHARLSLDPLIFRAYQAYTHRLKLRRPLIFEDYLALIKDGNQYKFYKSKCSRARDIRAARPARCGGYNAKLCLCQLILREYKAYKPRMILEPLILRLYQMYTPGVEVRRFSFATELVDIGKSMDPTSRWRVKQAAYQRSEKRAQVKGEEILLKIYSRARKMILQPRVTLEALCCRTYQTCTSMRKLRRPLIFEDYLALKLGSKLYNFYKYRNRPGASRESKMILQPRMILEPLILRAYQEYVHGLKLYRLLIKRLIFEAKLSFEALVLREYQVCMFGMNSCSVY